MKSFINVQDIGPLDKAMAEAFEIKNDRYKYQHLGKNKTLMMIFFNNSLRTRLSTQKLGPRGPMALEEICTYKWLIEGEGQVRN